MLRAPDGAGSVDDLVASAERAARFSRIKQIVVIVIAFPALYYLMDKPREHPTFTVIMVIGVLLVGITSKIIAKLDSITRTILQAIAELPQK